MHSFASTFMTASKGNREGECRGHNSKALEHDPRGSHLVLRESVKENPHFELQLLVMFGDPGALYIGEIRIKYQVSSTPLEKPVSYDCRVTMEKDSVLCKRSELSLGSLHQGKHSVTLDSLGKWANSTPMLLHEFSVFAQGLLFLFSIPGGYSWSHGLCVFVRCLH